jgi:hypothetical protein
MAAALFLGSEVEEMRRRIVVEAEEMRRQTTRMIVRFEEQELYPYP